MIHSKSLASLVVFAICLHLAVGNVQHRPRPNPEPEEQLFNEMFEKTLVKISLSKNGSCVMTRTSPGGVNSTDRTVTVSECPGMAHQEHDDDDSTRDPELVLSPKMFFAIFTDKDFYERAFQMAKKYLETQFKKMFKNMKPNKKVNPTNA